MSARKRNPKTAAELMRELEQNAEYVEQRNIEESARRQTERSLREEEGPLLEALSQVGISVGSVWDLVNSENSYRHALPVLAEHLERSYPARIKEGIARALTVPHAGPKVCAALLREFRRTRDLSPQGVKFALANALSVVAEEDSMDDLIDLVRDPREGECRAALVEALARFGGQRVSDVLHDLSTDPLIGSDARRALARIVKA